MEAAAADQAVAVLDVIPEDALLVKCDGNLGDELIHAGTRILFSRAERPIDETTHPGPCSAEHDCSVRGYGGTLVVEGSGAWCSLWNDPVSVVEHSEAGKIVVLPSTYDLDYEPAAEVLKEDRVIPFAREHVSLARVPDARFSLCPSFYFDYSPYHRAGTGVLHAFRTDAESRGLDVPEDNWDISLARFGLDVWLETIAAREEIHTDRAHVMIAGALMGKRVRWREGSYWKVGALSELLEDYDVEPL